MFLPLPPLHDQDGVTKYWTGYWNKYWAQYWTQFWTGYWTQYWIQYWTQYWTQYQILNQILNPILNWILKQILDQTDLNINLPYMIIFYHQLRYSCSTIVLVFLHGCELNLDINCGASTQRWKKWCIPRVKLAENIWNNPGLSCAKLSTAWACYQLKLRL